MLWRQTLSRGSRLDRYSTSPLTTALPLSLPLRIYDPLLRNRRPAEVDPSRGRSRRWLATHSTSTFANQLGDFPTLLDHLLKAIQLRNNVRIIPTFLNWVNSLNGSNAAALQELAILPVSTFSEILRCLDPVANTQLDVAHGLNIELGQLQFTNAGRIVDEFGVRHQHRLVLEAMKVLMRARLDTGRHLMVYDYEVLIRCAGAAADMEAAMYFFGAIAANNLASKRSTATWNEFIKARFLIDPMYYQFDRSRMAYTGRLAYRSHRRMDLANLWRIEGLRYAVNALKAQPFGRRRDRPWANHILWMRTKRGYWSYLAHWERSKAYGVLVDEELLCNTMIAFARSGSLKHIKGIVLKGGFRIMLHEDTKTGEVMISGGKRFRAGSPREPTKRFLNAIVETFGSMSHIATALKLLVFVSHTYGIPIPRETWSNLLNWAYICASKSNQFQRRMMGNHLPSAATDKHVVEIWKTMTSEPFNIEPVFEDYNIYIKTLIAQRRLRLALDLIRNYAVPHYRRLEDEHQQIVFDEVLQEVPEPSSRRLQIETQKEYVWYHIANCLNQTFSVASKNKWQREGEFMQVVIPDLVAEFSEFLHDQINYRTSQGYVRLRRSMETPRFDWVGGRRKTLPQLRGGMEARMMELQGKIETKNTFEERAEDWPMVPEMTVLEYKRKPRTRIRALGRPPESTDVRAREWWKNLEGELMT
ncbi:hypothetical protein F66182_9937 [Fusarium sp. NRRL 66182]|nr:hypothetical protein F66182_9937 [Fusarium sp. NRRL 66182]